MKNLSFKDISVGDKVRLKRGWNPISQTRTVTSVNIDTLEAQLDCTLSNGVKITAENIYIWEKVYEKISK